MTLHLHLDQPADGVIHTLISALAGWVRHGESQDEIKQRAFAFSLLVGHTLLPLEHTLYQRSDLDPRYGTGFTVYLDWHPLLERGLSPDQTSTIRLLVSREATEVASQSLAIAPTLAPIASQSLANRAHKRALLDQILIDNLPRSTPLPLNALRGAWADFDPSLSAKSDPVSCHGYGASIQEFLASFPAEAILLDVGCGLRDSHRPNVIHCEIYSYPSTDILCSCDQLPFQDSSVDGILSLAVLEHVADPFRCADELSRVLKPGGRILLKMPFLQAEHGYPHHFFNATREGVRQLFRQLTLERQWLDGADHPIQTLQQVVEIYASALPAETRAQFLGLTLADLFVLADPRLHTPGKEALLRLADPEAAWRIAWGTTSLFRKPDPTP